ncbi:MAG: hypothetical protein K9J77_02235 [Rhodoferax sp.]|nr:hypothetical protein [Rhodoferax sp.]
MKLFRLFLLALMASLAGVSSLLHAEDIDIYADTAASSGVPNVLFVIDNGANFSASASACSYRSGGAPSVADKAWSVEACALVDTIEALPDNSVNIGLMTYNGLNFADDVRNATDASFHEPCISASNGGCLLRKLTLMSPDEKTAAGAITKVGGKTNLINFIKSWTTSGSTSSTQMNIKVNNDATAATMQEAWAYYNGKVGLSGKDYVTSVLGSGCQKNFIIFIGNAFGTSGTPGDDAVMDADGKLTASQVNATDAQKAKIVETINFKASTCGSTSFSTTRLKADNWGDEWARLMYQQDGSSTLDNSQRIVTYTVGTIDNSSANSCRADYPAHLSSMAKYGGGKYFQTSNASEIANALTSILNEIQSVNSVFSSASLPVSVNAQGTYLNQIFLGMFRPDASANPRWLGNLKQYKFILDGVDPNNAKLKLGDSTGAEALSSSGTGFITPGAISYWTSKDTTRAPDDAATGGFFVKEPNPTGHDHFDSPDGELVERGGAAQQIRLENLNSNFGATAATTSNPRRLYTYLGTELALNHSSNAFAIENVNITAASLGDSTSVKVSSIRRTGTTALVTTNGVHGLSTGNVVTISNATPNEYNVTQAVTVNTSNSFTITGLPDYPTSPSQGTYTISRNTGTPLSVLSITRPGSAGASNTQTATVTTSSAHTFVSGDKVNISDGTSLIYDNKTVLPGPTSTTFTISVDLNPATPATNTYEAVISPIAYPSRGVTITNPKVNDIVGSLVEHGFHLGQSVVIKGTGISEYDGTRTITAVTTSTFTMTSNGTKNNATLSGSVVPDPAPKVVTLTRSEGTSAIATATGAPSGWFGNATNATKRLAILKKSGSSTNEDAYLKSDVTITCLNSSCTSFSYPLVTTPPLTASGDIKVALAGASEAISTGNITRDGSNMAKVTGVTSGAFRSGDSVTVASSGTPLNGESGYKGSAWVVKCEVEPSCTTLTFGPVTLTPAIDATGNNMQAYAAGVTPDKNSLVKWVRGEDNYGDELGPHNTISAITVRPSVHGDVLHSRPVVINFGVDPTGVDKGLVVFYGSNDGVFHAVNGSQTTSIGSVPPGGELWGLVLPEHFGKLNRQRVNSPELKLSTTALSSAQPKDYFVDGSVGAYQKLADNGSVATAYLYLTMRRGGNFMYALDVSTPTNPKFKWKISAGDTGFEELGQTWSRPRVTLVKGYTTNPILVFGGGYDPAEDSEPPATGTMGRGIFVVDAVTGVKLWSATNATVTGMNWSFPSDISFVDRNNDGYTDRFYAADLGGNVWRVDLEPTAGNTPSNWVVTKFAALGCDTGPCASGTPRKFFYRPNVVPVGATGASGSYDAVMLGSGDREHPLQSHGAYNVTNRFYVLRDTSTGMNGSTTPITETNLFNNGVVDGAAVTYKTADGAFYKTYKTGEKSVNESVTLRGTTYFGTNRPVPAGGTCRSNLGEAKGYALDPFSGELEGTIFDGGGMPPTPTIGIVTITIPPARSGDPTTSVKKAFCVGCGGGEGADSKSALGVGDPKKTVPKNMRRNYWYKK